MNNVVRVEDSKYLTGQGGSGGSGGHIIQNDIGTALPQESALQFVGVYSEDDSTNHKTKVNIIREMTKVQMDALSTDAKKGVIHTTDEPDNPANPISADDVSYGSGSVKDVLDAITPTVLNIPSITSDANGFIALGISNDRNVLSVSTVGYSFLFWKRSNGYWHATVLSGSNVPVPNSTFNNVKVLYT